MRDLSTCAHSFVHLQRYRQVLNINTIHYNPLIRVLVYPVTAGAVKSDLVLVGLGFARFFHQTIGFCWI